jgi:hypothetical protein
MSAGAHRGATAEPRLRGDAVRLDRAVVISAVGHAVTETADLVRS